MKLKSLNRGIPGMLFLCFVRIAVPAQLPTTTLYTASVFTPKDGFTHGVEGPAVDKTGTVYAVNFARDGTIGKISPAGEATVFISLPEGSIGNGIRFDNHGNMLIADYVNHNVFRVDMKTKELKTLAHEPRMTQPNDLAVDSRGHVFASDPDFKAGSGRIWRVDPDGKVSLLDSMSSPANGIDLSPDEKIFYVSAGKSVYAYDINENGELSHQRLLIAFPDFGVDGLRCDSKGNIYLARFGKGVIAKISPGGKLLREIILTGKRCTNVAFGGKDGCTVYVTLMDQGNLESFRVESPGREWVMSGARSAQTVKINNDAAGKKIVFGNGKITATLDYNKKVNISLLEVNGQKVIESEAGIYSAIRTSDATYSTLHLSASPSVQVAGHTIRITGIQYGNKHFAINEVWTFNITDSNIRFGIDRELPEAIAAEQVAFPVFMFNNIHTWEGAYQDYGGLAWFYLFNKKSDTYGVHSSSSRFWNSKTGNGLTVSVDAPGKQVAMDYSRTAEDKLAYTIAVSQKEMTARFDSGTNRRRFIRDRSDVWAPLKINAGKTSQHITLSYFNFNESFGRGKLVGINGEQVSAVLNTIARIGVIDKQHFGGNSWHTPYGPICLHEQYIAQMGLAINDKTYLKGYQECLDFYRDNAIKPSGRVWPRWAYTNEDMMPGEVTAKGFYEAQWGYLMDSNPDLVTNVSELYDQTGDKAWVKTHQASCEKALDWILKRDSNGNGLVEMMTDSHTQKRGSDWIDIIWASYENAFVNAKLYHALVLWAAIEKQLGNAEREKYYDQSALKLKASFNKPVSEGGFWDDEKKCYIHWRDKDGSIHGNNMVTPVNFMAIAYGICDDDSRRKTILDNIEIQMQKENLFFWPICLYSYGPGEGNDWQFPFPNYENGDLFLSWGSVAVKAYADYKPELALKYVKNVLDRYAKDGLAFQRYGRAKQDGLGDDILSGNSLSVVGLYQAIYGINPLYNRFYLNPHITPDLAGTEIKYNYRDQKLTIGLNMNQYSVSNDQFKITACHDFGFYSLRNELLYFNRNSADASLKIKTTPNRNLSLEIKSWNPDQMSWMQFSEDMRAGRLVYQISNLKADSYYTILINNKILKRLKTTFAGILLFDYKTNKNPEEIAVLKK